MATTESKTTPRPPEIPAEMTAMRLHEYGGPEVLQADTVPVPDYGPRDVLVRVKTLSVNGWDSRLRRGHAPQLPGRKPIELPLQPGREMAGEVVAKGDLATRHEIGDRVVLMSNPSCGQCPLCARGDRNFCVGVEAPGQAGTGTYAEYMSVPETWLLKIPDSVSDQQAATVIWGYGNSLHAVNIGKVGLGSVVAVTAASSAMGIACIQLAKLKGAKAVIALSRSPEKADRLLEAGADHVVDYTADDGIDKIRAIAGTTPFGGVDVVLDNYGSQELMDLAVMITGLSARIVLIASNAESFAEKVGASSQIMIGKHLSVLASRSARYEEQTLALELAAAGRIRMPIEEVFDLTDVRRAHELLESGSHVGKIAVRV